MAMNRFYILILALFLSTNSWTTAFGQGLGIQVLALPTDEVIWGNQLEASVAAFGGTQPYSHGLKVICAKAAPGQIVVQIGQPPVSQISSVSCAGKTGELTVHGRVIDSSNPAGDVTGSDNITVLAPNKIELEQNVLEINMNAGEFSTIGTGTARFAVKYNNTLVGSICAFGNGQERLRVYQKDNNGNWIQGQWGTWGPPVNLQIYNFESPFINDLKGLGYINADWNAFAIGQVIGRYDQQVRIIYFNCSNQEQILTGDKTYEVKVVKTGANTAEVRFQ